MADQNIEDFPVVSPSPLHNILVTEGAGTPIVGQRPVSGILPQWVAATVTLPDGAGVFDHTQTITAEGVAPTDTLSVMLAPALDANENVPEMLSLTSLSALAGTGEFTLTLEFAERSSGPINILWRQ